MFTFNDQPLSIPTATGLTVVYAEETIANPRILTARIENAGPADLTPAALTGGHLCLHAEPESILAASSTGGTVTINQHADKDCLSIDPANTPPGKAIIITAVAVKPTKAHYSHNVANFAVTSLTPVPLSALVIAAVIPIAIVIVAMTAALVALQLSPQVSGLNPYVVAPISAGIALAVVYGTSWLFRPKDDCEED